MSGLIAFISKTLQGAQSNTTAGLTGPQAPAGTIAGIASTGSAGTVSRTALLTKVLGGIFTTALQGTLTTSRALSLTGVQGAGSVSFFGNSPFFGTNLSGLESAGSGVRYGASTQPNLNFTMPRLSLMQYLVANGCKIVRLPFSWELLQPILASGTPNSVVKAGYGVTAPGDLEPTFSAVIQSVLDNAATAGLKVILDCHNYCRYQDFVYNADGSVTGFTAPGQPVKPYTSNSAKVVKRLMSLNPGFAPSITISQTDFNSLWTKIAQKWGAHAALGGYGLMHEPQNMPATNGIREWYLPRTPSSGANVHEGGSSTGNNTTMVNTFVARGISQVRMDLWPSPGNQTLVTDFITKAVAAGINVQGIILARAQGDSTIYTGAGLSTQQANNQADAQTVVDRYFPMGVKDYELLNEVPLRSECQAQVPAYGATNINESTYTGKTAFISIGAALKGMATAVHGKDPSCRVILGTIGRDWGFLKYMSTLGVVWDVLGYHNYPGNGQALWSADTWYGPGGLYTVMAGFNRPVTINEFNASEIYGNLGTYGNAENDPVTENGFSSNIKFWRNMRDQTTCNLESVVWYEMLDEPGKPVPENRFGLMYDLATPKVSLFIAAAFAGGTLSGAERTKLTNRGMTTNEINAMQMVEDLTIWGTFAQGAVTAIRAVDSATPIYVSGNGFSTSVGWGTQNPSFPLTGLNLVYEAHLFLDSANTGRRYDWAVEVAVGTSVGEGGAISTSTGVNRLAPFTTWLTANNAKGFIGDTGMPVDDPNWYTSFRNLMGSVFSASDQLVTGLGGEHWANRNNAINSIPNWYQKRTCAPLVEATLKERNGNAVVTYFDASTSYGNGAAGQVVTVTVFARGYLSAGVTVTLTRTAGAGTLSVGSVVVPAGVNPSVTYTYTAAVNEVAQITYSGPAQVPPVRKIYNLTDPVAYAATSLTDAAHALCAKYGASKWEMADAYTDYVQGAAVANGNKLRAVSDSGFGSSQYNIYEMVNGMSEGASPNMGAWVVPTAGIASGHTSMVTTDQFNTLALWCKKVVPDAVLEGTPYNLPLYKVSDNHFIISCFSTSNIALGGTVFQTGLSTGGAKAEIFLSSGTPQGRWVDSAAGSVTCTAASALAANVPAVVTATYNAGAMNLRLNTVSAASGARTLAATPTDQHLLGWSYSNFFPNGAAVGNHYGSITGKGAPTAAELTVLERYLGNTLAGMSL